MMDEEMFEAASYEELTFVAGDIETTGFYDDDVITSFTLAHEGEYVAWTNVDGASGVEDDVQSVVDDGTALSVDVRAVPDEAALLAGVREYVTETLDSESAVFVFYNGERWNGGFDLRFIRSACLRTGAVFPFAGYAYLDLLPVFGKRDRFNVTHIDPDPDLGDLFNKGPLKSFADSLGVEYSGSWRKGQIVEAIEAAESFSAEVLEWYCESNGVDAPDVNPRGLVQVFGRVARLMRQRDSESLSSEWLVEDPDPFGPDESVRAVEAFRSGDFGELVLHNVADVHKTGRLASLLGESGGMIAKDEVTPTFF
jgi:hypothetical protein